MHTVNFNDSLTSHLSLSLPFGPCVSGAGVKSWWGGGCQGEGNTAVVAVEALLPLSLSSCLSINQHHGYITTAKTPSCISSGQSTGTDYSCLSPYVWMQNIPGFILPACFITIVSCLFTLTAGPSILSVIVSYSKPRSGSLARVADSSCRAMVWRPYDGFIIIGVVVCLGPDGSGVYTNRIRISSRLDRRVERPALLTRHGRLAPC